MFSLTKKAAEKALGGPISALLSKASAREGARPRTRDLESVAEDGSPAVTYEDLELGRIIGAGQFGLVRIAQHRTTKSVYALKVCIALLACWDALKVSL